WYLRMRQLPEVPAELLQTLRGAAEFYSGTEPDIIRRRYQRLASVFGKVDAFQNEHTELVRRFLDTEDGRKRIEQQLGKEMERRATDSDREVRRRQGELTDEEKRLKGELESLHARHRQDAQVLEERLAALQAQHDSLQAANQSLREYLQAGLD